MATLSYAFRWIASFFREQIVEVLPSAVTPGLRVSLRSGRLRLDAHRANYSYGELQQLWDEVFAEAGLAQGQVQQALVLGLGGGGVVRLIHRLHPAAEVTAVELDPAVIGAARRWFRLPTQGLTIVEGDAAQAVLTLQTQFRLIVVDLFIDDVVPDAFGQQHFYRELRRLLAPDGTLLANRIIDTPSARAATAAARERFQVLFPSLRTYRLPGNEVWIAES